MNLFHTSPNKITKINTFGKFADCLFFADKPYYMTSGNAVVYKIDAEDMDFISASQLYDEEIVSEICNRFNCDEDTAEALLDGRESVWNHEFADADNDWWIQELQGRCAKKMGYDGCKSRDEQGVVYIIPMFGRENLLEQQ